MRHFKVAVILVQIVGCAALIHLVAANQISNAAIRATTPPFRLDPYKPTEISLADMMLLTRQGGTVVVDGRTPEAFAQGRIAGAINLPLGAVLQDESTIDRLPSGPNLVVYCDGPGCLLSSRLGRLIREHTGRNVAVYEGGWHEWQLLKLPHDE